MEKASHKVPDGKMLKIKLEKEKGRIKHAELRGDFFLEPAEKLSEIEASLEGLSEKAGLEEVTEKVGSVDAEMIGFAPEDVAEAFRKAVGGNDE